MNTAEQKIYDRINEIMLKFEALGKTKDLIPKIKVCESRSTSQVCRLDYSEEKSLARFFIDVDFIRRAPKLHVKCKITRMIVQLISLLYFGNSQVENVRYIESIIIKETL